MGYVCTGQLLNIRLQVLLQGNMFQILMSVWMILVILMLHVLTQQAAILVNVT